QAQRERQPFTLALRQRADARMSQAFQLQRVEQFRRFDRRRIEPLKKSERPIDGLLRPGSNAVRPVEQRVFTMRGGKHLLIPDERATVSRRNAGKTFKERSFARAVWPDQTQDFASPHAETYILQYRARSEFFGEAVDCQQIHR